MVIYRKLLPRTKRKAVFYLSLKISSLHRLASYDEYPPIVCEGVWTGPGWVIGRIGRVPGGPLPFWAGREFYFLTFVTLVHILLK